jgi:hypothetical protein
MVGPAAAKELSDLGYDRKKLEAYIFDQTSVPYEQL